MTHRRTIRIIPSIPNNSAMIDKGKEEIAADHIANFNKYFLNRDKEDVYDAMQAYADQEVKKAIPKILRWSADNNVRPSCGFWQKDYSIIAYTDEKIAEEFFLKQLDMKQHPEQPIPKMSRQLAAEADVAAIEYGNIHEEKELDHCDLTNAFEAGQNWMFQALSQTPSAPVMEGWFSTISGYTPEIGEYVLVCLEGDTILKGKLLYNGWVAFFADGEKKVGPDRYVTHWMAIPKGPTEETPVPEAAPSSYQGTAPDEAKMTRQQINHAHNAYIVYRQSVDRPVDYPEWLYKNYSRITAAPSFMGEEPMEMQLAFENHGDKMDIVCPDEGGDFCIRMKNKGASHWMVYGFQRDDARKIARFLISNADNDEKCNPPTDSTDNLQK